jgi:hypothetical protein
LNVQLISSECVPLTDSTPSFFVLDGNCSERKKPASPPLVQNVPMQFELNAYESAPFSRFATVSPATQGKRRGVSSVEILPLRAARGNIDRIADACSEHYPKSEPQGCGEYEAAAAGKQRLVSQFDSKAP